MFDGILSIFLMPLVTMKSHEHLIFISQKIPWKSEILVTLPLNPMDIPLRSLHFSKKTLELVSWSGKSMVGKLWEKKPRFGGKTMENHSFSENPPDLVGKNPWLSGRGSGTATAPWPRWRLEPWLWRRSLDSAMRRSWWARWAGAVAPGEGKP